MTEATATARRVRTADQLRPAGDHVVVREDEPEEQVDGLYIPDTAQKQPTTGTVLAAGPGRRNEATGEREPMRLEVGDRVLYGKWSGTAFETVKDGEVLLIRQEHVLALLEEEDAAGGGSVPE